MKCSRVSRENKDHDTKTPPDLWSATLVEVSRQIVLNSCRKDTHDADDLYHTYEPWPQTQWAVAFKILVYEMPEETTSTEKDDLIFLLDTHNKEIITRRQTTDASSVFDEFDGSRIDVIDWKASVMMYIIMHTSFRFSALVDRAACLDSRIQAVMKYKMSSKEAVCDPTQSSCSSSLQREKRDTTTAYDVLPTKAVFRDSSPYPDIVFVSLEDTLHSDILLIENTCFACVLGADVQHSWGVSSCSSNHGDGYHQHQAHDSLIQVFSGYVTFDQVHAATENPVARQVVSRLQKFIRQHLHHVDDSGVSPPTEQQPQHTLDLRGYQDSGIAHVSAQRTGGGIEIHVKDLHVYTFESMAVQICQHICQRHSVNK